VVADPQAVVQALIAARTSAGGKAALQSLLAQAAEADPATAAVVQLLAQRDASPLERESEPDDDATVARREAVERRRTAVARVRGQLEALGDRMAALEARDARFAHALGACPTCWGEEANCPVCNGAGRAGWRRPDQPLFEALIQPALRRLMPQRLRQTVAATPRLAESQTTTP
jgi:hypothetical protein